MGQFTVEISCVDNASVSSSYLCYARLCRSKHMASGSLHSFKGEKISAEDKILHRQQRCRCWSRRSSSWSCCSIFCQPAFQPMQKRRKQEQKYQQSDFWRTDFAKCRVGIRRRICRCCFSKQCIGKSLWKVEAQLII